MADVGSVSVGVVVHGDGLGEKLAATIRAAILPVIRDLNRELQTTKRRSDAIDGSGFQRLAVAAREAAIAVHSVGEAHQRTARYARTATLEQIAYYDQVADAAERSAQRQIEAAIAVSTARAAIPADSGGGGGVPDIPIRSGNNGGRRQGGFLGAALSPVGLNVFATLSNAIDPAVLGVAELTRSLVDLGGAGLALPGIFAGLASSISTAVLGFQGFGTAVKEAFKAASTGEAKDLEKAAKALEKLSPNAQATTKALLEFAPAFKSLRDQVQENIFENLDTSLRSFLTTSLPTLKTGLGDIGKAWNDTFQELLRVGGTDQTQGFFGKIFGNTAQAQRQLNNAIQPLVSGMGRLAAEGSDFLPRLADGITKVSTRFDNFIAKSVSNGDLDRWIDRGFKGFAQLGNSIINVGKIIGDITRALGGDGKTFLEWLEDGTRRLDEFLSSTEGQTMLSDFFNNAREMWKDVGPVLSDMVRLLGDVVKGFQLWGQVTMPILRPILDALTSFPGLISGAIAAFLGFRTLKGIGDLLGIGKAARELDALPAAAERSARGVRGALSNLLPAAGIALGAGALGSSLITPADGSDPSTLEALGGLGVNVGGGAAAGYMIGGPVGAAVGGVTGAVISLLEVVKRDIDQGRRDYEAYRGYKETPEQQAADAASRRASGRDVIENPSLLTPGGPGYIREQIESGSPLFKGYTIDANNNVVAPDGTVLPLNLPPGATPYVPSSKYPTGQGPIPAPTAYGPTNPAQIVNPPLPPLPSTVQPTAPPSVVVPPGLGGLLGDASLSGTRTTLEEITNTIRDLPKGKIEIESRIPEVQEALKTIAGDITSLPTGEIKITDPSPQLKEALQGVDAQITSINNNEIVVKGTTAELQTKLEALVRQYQGLEIQINLKPVLQPGPALPGGAPVQGPPVGGGRAMGGVIPGYSPGVDTTLVPLSGGEGIIIPEAMRALGPRWLYNLNSSFRSGISTQGYASGGIFSRGAVPWPGKPDPKDPKKWPWPIGPLTPNLIGPVPGILRGPDWSGSDFGAPPPGWWTTPINPDDYLFPDWWTPDKKGIWKYPGSGFNLLGFESGGVFSLEEWLRKHPGQYPTSAQLAQMAEASAPAIKQQINTAVATGPKPPTSYIGKAVSTPLLENPSKTTSLGFGPTPNVNAAPGFQASQNLTNLRAGVQAAVQANVEGTIEAITNPVETLKAMAPLVGLGGAGAPGVAEAWTNVGKGIVNWDQWATDPWGAAGGTAVNLGALIYGGRKLPGQVARGASRAAARVAPYGGSTEWLSTIGLPTLSSLPPGQAMAGLAMAAMIPPKAGRRGIDDPGLLSLLDLIPDKLTKVELPPAPRLTLPSSPTEPRPRLTDADRERWAALVGSNAYLPEWWPNPDDPAGSGYRPVRYEGYGSKPRQTTSGPTWDTGLQDILMQGSASLPPVFNDVFLDVANHWGFLWAAAASFDKYKDMFRQGAQDAFRGRQPWGDPIRDGSGSLLDPYNGMASVDPELFQMLVRQLSDMEMPGSLGPKLAPDEAQGAAKTIGSYIATFMETAADVSTEPLFRGMTLPSSEAIEIGSVIPWALSSVGTEFKVAKAYSGARDFESRFLYEGQTSRDEFQDMLARVQEGQIPTVFIIEPGARYVPVNSGESVVSGQMEVVRILEASDPTNTAGVRQVVVRQLTPGYATGGVLPGFSPGVDNMLVPLSGGEGIIIPEAMRALGPRWLYDLNSRFRSGLSPAGYANGGVVGFADGGIPTLGPGPDDGSVIGLLIQIRDLLAGGGGQANPMNQVAANTSQMSTALDSGPGTQNRDFGYGFWADGTPRNPGYEMMSAVIGSLGGDPAKFLGPNPALPVPTQSFGGTGIGLGAGGVGLPGSANLNVDALRAFALSGDTAALSGTGLDPADPIVAAIATARNKKKGALGPDTIAGLVDQVIGGSGFDGVMDASNSTLISAMQRYKEKMLKQRPSGASPTMASPAALGVIPDVTPTAAIVGSGGYAMDRGTAAVALAQASSGGKYSWGGSDLVNGLSDCTGAVSDLVEVITTGRTSPGRLFSTANAASVLPQLGAVPGLVPGMLQIGFNDGHMAATLPNGVNFESGGGTGQGATYGGAAVGANASQFTQQWSVPVDGTAMIPADLASTMASGGIGANPLGYNGAPVPVYIVNGPGGGTGAEGMLGLLNGPMGEIGGVGAGVGMDAIDAIIGTGDRPLPEKVAAVSKLLQERNPMALASILGIQIGDYSRAGGANDPLMTNDKKFLPDGTLLSDTGALSNRTVTDKDATKNARQEQLLDLTSQVRDNLSKDALTPIMQNGVAGGIASLDISQLSTMGQALGQAAADPIAQSVSRAIAQMPPPAAPAAAPAPSLPIPIPGVGGFAEGGPIVGPGTGTSDSILARLSNGEYVVPAADVRAAGGFAAIDAWRRSLPGYATGGGVVVNDTLGADFFGVSQVPIIGAIVNALISILLNLIGVQITARDTLNEMSSDVRQFRGDFQKFDATGRLMNDTSALLDRTGSSSQAAADERIRILKIVIEELIQYIIDNIVIPIGKAVANAAIQAGAGAAGAAINTQAPGAGSLVSSLISSAGTAGVDIGAKLFSAAWASITPVVADSIGELLKTLLPGITTSVFGGGLLAKIFDPLTAGFSGLAGMFATLFGAVLGGASFDEGGIASGVGLLPKATIQPERVLSPQQTASFDRLVGLLEGGTKAGTNTTIHAPFTVVGGEQAGRQVRDRLLALMS